MVRVKPSIRPTETYTEPNFLRLHTVPAEEGRLVTIEHLSYKAGEQNGTGKPGVSGWSCQTVVDGEAMSKEDALFIARSYAKENRIPVIYECHSD
jgi:hypothetical protein